MTRYLYTTLGFALLSILTIADRCDRRDAGKSCHWLDTQTEASRIVALAYSFLAPVRGVNEQLVKNHNTSIILYLGRIQHYVHFHSFTGE